MRRAALQELCEEAFGEHFGERESEDVAERVLSDEAFPALCQTLNSETDGSREDISGAIESLVEEVTDDELDWLAEEAANPAAWLANKAKQVV